MNWKSPNVISLALFFAFLVYVVARGEYKTYWRLAFPAASTTTATVP